MKARLSYNEYEPTARLILKSIKNGDPVPLRVMGKPLGDIIQARYEPMVAKMTIDVDISDREVFDNLNKLGYSVEVLD